VGYALFGSSRQLAIGPTSAISLLVGATIAGMAAGDPARWAQIAALTALVTAGMCVIAWALRLSSLVNFISETILLGFKAGAALTIATTQLPKLFGVKGGGEGFFERLVVLWDQLPSTRLPVPLLRRGRHRGPAARRAVPSRQSRSRSEWWSSRSFCSPSTGSASSAFSVVGALPRGLPDLQPPALRPREVDGLLPLAFACLCSPTWRASRRRGPWRRHTVRRFDPRQELLGLGAANLAAAVFQSYPVAGGLSQSSVNDKAGARTPLSLVFASTAIAICLLFLTGTLATLPNVVLAAIVLVAVKGLISIRDLRHLRKVSRSEFRMSMAAFAAVLVLGILKGVMLACGDLAGASDPARGAPPRRVPRACPRHKDLLGPATEPGETSRYLERSSSASRRRCSTSTWRTCARPCGREIRAAPKPLKLLLLDLSSSPAMDVAGARMVAGLEEELRGSAIIVRLVGARASVRDILRAEGLEEHVGQIDRRLTVEDVVEEFQRGDGARASA
jgi:MFS superfamily sulfate permease-like transporter